MEAVARVWETCEMLRNQSSMPISPAASPSVVMNPVSRLRVRCDAPPRMASAGDDPFNFGILRNHGTSVASIAAAASNGVGGRGVAPEVTLRRGLNDYQAA